MINKIYIPKENEKDLKDIPDNIKENIKFVLVNDYIDIYNDIKRGKK